MYYYTVMIIFLLLYVHKIVLVLYLYQFLCRKKTNCGHLCIHQYNAYGFLEDDDINFSHKLINNDHFEEWPSGLP